MRKPQNMETDAQKRPEVAGDAPSRSRASFWVHSVLRRVPGYLFLLMHMAFLHILWGNVMDELFTSGFLLFQTNFSDAEKAMAVLTKAGHNARRSVDEHLWHGLADVYKTKCGPGADGIIAVAHKCVAHLWKSPSSMMLLFGLVYISLNALLTVARLFGAILTSFTAPCRSRGRLERGGSRRPIPLYITVRYGNGYDSVLRFMLATAELVWFMSYPVLTVAATMKGASDKGRRTLVAMEPTYASLRQLQERQQAIASFQIAVSLLLPPQLFSTAADALTSGRFVLLFVKMLLGLVVALEAQHLFHAFVGVRPLFIPNGWDRCPVCGDLWKRSRRAKDSVHLCPIIFGATPRIGNGEMADAAASDAEREEMRAVGRGAALDGPMPPQGRAWTTTTAMAMPYSRPGDAFPDPNKVSRLSLVMDSWVNPLMNFTLLSPLTTFAPPALSSISPDGHGHWRALLDVVDRLPRLPHYMRTRENLDEPAWAIWKRRHLPPAPGEVGRLERCFMWLTTPLRRVLSHAYALFFLPAAARDTAAAPGRGDHPSAARSNKPSLFHAFLRHPTGREFVYVCVPLKLTEDLLSLLAPRIVKSLVSFLKEVSVADLAARQSYVGHGLWICLSLILAVSLQAVFFQLYLTHLYTVGVKATSSLKSLLLRHSLETPLAYTGNLHDRSTTKGHSVAAKPESPQSPARPVETAEKNFKVSPVSPNLKALVQESAAPAALSREGEVMALLTVDTTTCGDCLIFLHNVWGHPFLIISSLLSMYTYVGLFSTLATFATLVALIPLNRSTAARVRTAQQQAKNNESRLSDLSAALSTMRTVRAMALEKSLVARVEEARTKESDGSKRVGRAESVAAAQTEVTTLLVALVCCGSYLLTGGKMDAAVLVPTMAALQVMRFPVWTLPHLYSQVSRGYASMKRIERFLSESEIGLPASATDAAPQRQPPSTEVDGRESQQPTDPLQTGEVRCSGSTFAWNTRCVLVDELPNEAAEGKSFRGRASEDMQVSNALSRSVNAVKSENLMTSPSTSVCSSPRFAGSRTVVLRGITLEVQPGEFVVLHGSTGSGKSALLLAMLGELYVMPGESLAASLRSPAGAPTALQAASFGKGFQIGGRVAYCAEVPWLRQGTVRENIRLLGDDVPESPSERDWYARVLEACALQKDIQALAKGDRTMVGEGGSKLSGGQRARVALARAVYRYAETDVFIFDDILSALDVEVQRHIIAHVFHGLLNPAVEFSPATAAPMSRRRAKTIVLASHVAVHHLMPDRVLYVWPDGTLHEDAAYQPPSEEHVLERKKTWRSATAAAAEAKGHRRSIQLSAGPHRNSSALASGVCTPRPKTAPATPSSAGCRPLPSTAPPPPMTPTGINSLLPRAADLHRLFIHYVGGWRMLLCLLLSLLMQLFRTLMDNWLGVYISLYDKRNAAYETILRSTKSQRARKFMLDFLSLIVERGEKGTPPPPPIVPAFTVLGFPVVWHNPFVMDTVVSQFLGTYAFIGFSAALLSMLRTDYFFRSYQRMADALQLHAVRKLFKAPVSYFDRIPSSRLLQILSRDQEVVDRSLGDSVQLIFLTILQLLGMVCFNAFQFAPFLAVLPISALLFYHLTVRFLSLTKQVRALESVLQSRSVAVMKDAVSGSITIRAFGPVLQDQLLLEMNEALDAVHVAANTGLTADRWVALRLEFVALAFTSALALLSVLTVCLSPTTSAGSAAFAGLGIISSMTASKSLSMLCRRFGMFQNQFVSAEQLLRLQEEIPEEKPVDPEASDVQDSSETDPRAPPLLDVRHLCAKYQPQLPWVLSDIFFTLQPGECIGLIGRTGNGKSSLFNALLGLMDVVEGEIRVPGECVSSSPASRQVNALHLSQHGLRKNFFGLVSQEPLLLEGTCRSNLLLGLDEGSGRHPDGSAEPTDADAAAARASETDARLCEVLRKVSLDELLEPSPAAIDPNALAAVPNFPEAPGTTTESVASPNTVMNAAANALLDHVVTAGGSNLSAGQRQLLCLARALLHQPRVVLLDEVSSRVDRHTDELIQRVIKEEMLHRRPGASDVAGRGDVQTGVLLIAHRLETILSLCDRVLVIEKGRCVAFLSKEEVSTLEDLESYL